MQPVTMFTALQKYADFNGRARRSEFWLFVLFEFIAFCVVGLVGSILIGVMGGGNANNAGASVVSLIMISLFCLLVFGLFIPRLAVAVRRLHDSNKSGWLLLIAFIPFGAFVLLVFYCLDGTSGTNQYGKDPKAPPTSAAETFA